MGQTSSSAAAGIVLGGRYRLERSLGQGGIGVVWEAADSVTGGRVAIKTIRPELVAREDMRRRLMREAKAAAAISHPNLVRIHEVISGPDSAPALVMELLEGESLEARLTRQGKLSLAETASVLLPVFVALRALHAKGIVHRDLKPANIFLARAPGTDAGAVEVKLLDFGLVKWVDPSQALGLSQSLTASGAQVGTPYYMAPEQVLGEATVDQRADVFAAGVVLFECLAGARPTEAATKAQVFKKTLTGTFQSLAEAVPALPPEVAAVVDRMLAKDPEQRLPDLGPAIELLARYTDAGAIREVPVRVRRPRRWLLLSGAAGGAALLAGLLAWSLRPPAPIPIAGMAFLAGGTFTMGQSPEAVAKECEALGAACQQDLLQREQPARQVELSPFYLDVVEVTNEDFARFLNLDPRRWQVKDDPKPPAPQENRYVMDSKDVLVLDLRSVDNEEVHGSQGIRYAPSGGRSRFELVPGKERWPVVQVTWDGARMFCESRGKRLPTEAEWELAARERTSRRYPWGDEPPSCDAVVFGRSRTGSCSMLSRHPEPVGTAARDVTPGHGIRDLAGNVSEWVADWFAVGVYGACRNPGCKDERVDPPPEEQEADPFMIVRGSSWASERFLRTTRRVKWHRRSISTSIGFRCAMTAPAR